MGIIIFLLESDPEPVINTEVLRSRPLSSNPIMELLVSNDFSTFTPLITKNDISFAPDMSLEPEDITNSTISTPVSSLDPLPHTSMASYDPLATTQLTTPIDFSSDPECGYLVRSPFPAYSRLGNHMFVYASFYGMAKSQEKLGANKTYFFHVDESPTDLDNIFENLTLPQRVVENSWFSPRNFTKLKEISCCKYDKKGLENMACDGQNFYIKGYRSSFVYFKNFEDEIRREFKFNSSLAEKCEKSVNEVFEDYGLQRNNCVTVGVHLRRGDMVPEDPNDTSFYYVPAKTKYLKKVVRFHESLLSVHNDFEQNNETKNCLVFLIFGDDPDWNAKAIKKVNLLRPESTHLLLMDRHSTPAVDLCAMTLCDHFSLSVGTFGWWGGFFSRGIVTYQKQFAAALTPDFEPKEYFLPHWIPL